MPLLPFPPLDVCRHAEKVFGQSGNLFGIAKLILAEGEVNAMLSGAPFGDEVTQPKTAAFIYADFSPHPFALGDPHRPVATDIGDSRVEPFAFVFLNRQMAHELRNVQLRKG